MRLILNLQNDQLPNKAGISSPVKLPGTVKCNELPKSRNNMPLKAGICWVNSALMASARAQLATHRVTLVCCPSWPSRRSAHLLIRVQTCAPAQPGSTPAGHRPPSASKLYLREERVASARLIPFQRRSKLRVLPQWNIWQLSASPGVKPDG